MMRRISIITSLFFLIILNILSLNGNYEIVEDLEDLEKIEENKLFLVKNTVIEEKIKDSGRLIYLENGLEMECECEYLGNLIGKEVSIIAFSEKFNDKNYLKILEIYG